MEASRNNGGWEGTKGNLSSSTLKSRKQKGEDFLKKRSRLNEKK